MPEALVAFLAGASLAALLLFVCARAPAGFLAEQGFVILSIMLAIYFGAFLTQNNFQRLMVEFAIGCVWLLGTRLAMIKWRPAIGISILAHGAYDFAIGHSTGVASWYPPLCVGFDVVAGFGLIFLLSRKN